MKAIFDFSEIHSLVKSKTGREVVLSAISERFKDRNKIFSVNVVQISINKRHNY